MKTELGFGVSIEVHKEEDTPKEMTGLIISNDKYKEKKFL